jgi:hypothetical protein
LTELQLRKYLKQQLQVRQWRLNELTPDQLRSLLEQIKFEELPSYGKGLLESIKKGTYRKGEK